MAITQLTANPGGAIGVIGEEGGVGVLTGHISPYQSSEFEDVLVDLILTLCFIWVFWWFEGAVPSEEI